MDHQEVAEVEIEEVVEALEAAEEHPEAAEADQEAAEADREAAEEVSELEQKPSLNLTKDSKAFTFCAARTMPS